MVGPGLFSRIRAGLYHRRRDGTPIMMKHFVRAEYQAPETKQVARIELVWTDKTQFLGALAGTPARSGWDNTSPAGSAGPTRPGSTRSATPTWRVQRQDRKAVRRDPRRSASVTPAAIDALDISVPSPRTTLPPMHGRRALEEARAHVSRGADQPLVPAHAETSSGRRFHQRVEDHPQELDEEKSSRRIPAQEGDVGHAS
jgi:hypothetical protein